MALRTLLLTVLLLATAPLFAAPDGARLYSQHCAVCHGSQGHGGVGVPIALPAFLATVDDDYLFKTIRDGRPGRVMPAFTDLSDSQVHAIVSHVRSWAPPSQKKSTPLATKVKGNVAHGKQLFAKYCASCHGANGEGGHGTGVTFSRPRELPVMPPALNNSGFLHSASDEMIKQTLMKGREGTPMVSFLSLGLKERDINDIVAFVRSFEQAPIVWKPAEEPAVLQMESPYSMAETIENLKRAIVGKNFTVVRIQTLDNGFVSEKEEDQRQVIIYFCNFGFINQALSLDPRIGLFMPCRVTVVEQKGVVKVMSINPKYLSRLFNNEELDRPCEEMTEIYKGILEEATI